MDFTVAKMWHQEFTYTAISNTEYEYQRSVPLAVLPEIFLGKVADSEELITLWNKESKGFWKYKTKQKLSFKYLQSTSLSKFDLGSTPEEEVPNIISPIYALNKEGKKKHHGSAVLNAEDVINARNEYRTGQVTLKVLSEKYNIHLSALDKAIKGLTYSHLNEMCAPCVKRKLSDEVITEIRTYIKVNGDSAETRKYLHQKYKISLTSLSGIINEKRYVGIGLG